ncbi:hypothetical protein [Micromonospora sp. C95]|uniref:hypothetical protein n=1 Tax=Micromonospora sp. C95 TaxID=2824882 RepID=UPI001B39B4CF|nr:hypothetical protein [Micromonospora sp. C95]MBQ1023729.1 hypothetical protein [Micromonospora sp. C95]
MKVTAQALDVVYGQPAAGVPTRLERRTPKGWEPVAEIAVVVGLLADTDACQIQVLLAPYSCSMFLGARS